MISFAPRLQVQLSTLDYDDSGAPPSATAPVVEALDLSQVKVINRKMPNSLVEISLINP